MPMGTEGGNGRVALIVAASPSPVNAGAPTSGLGAVGTQRVWSCTTYQPAHWDEPHHLDRA